MVNDAPNDAPSTVTEALQLLRQEGWDVNFQLYDGKLHRAGGPPIEADHVDVDRVYRFEGPSDPGDEMIVVAVTHSASGARGAIAAGYGPAADPDHVLLLSALEQRFNKEREVPLQRPGADDHNPTDSA